MSNISKIKVGNTTYDIADAPARADIADLKEQIEQSGGLSSDVKIALMAIANHVVWDDDDPTGQTYINALQNALYPSVIYTAISLSSNSLTFGTLNATQQLTATTTPSGGLVTWSSSDTSVATVSPLGVVTSIDYGTATITATCGELSATCSVVIEQTTLSSISAVYTQSGSVYEYTPLSSLKTNLVVTAHWSNNTTSTVASTDYTLSGTLEEGTSTITVSYDGETTTVNVVVSAVSLPEGYTRYDYIQKKSNSSQNVADTKLIILNSQPNLNELSLSAIIAKKSGYYNDGGCMGVRTTSTWTTGFGMYWASSSNHAKLQLAIRGAGIEETMSEEIPDTATKIDIINPATSPVSVYKNGTLQCTLAWTNSSTNNNGFRILAFPVPGTSSTTMNHSARIGKLKFYKYETEECVGYYVPAVYDGVIGMYDAISQAFYTSSDSTSTTIANSGCLYAVDNWSQ